MVVLLLTPSIIKLEHHHSHSECNSNTEKKVQTFHEKCLICSFEFSVFSSTKSEPLSEKAEYKDRYNKRPYSSYYSDCSEYSFSLRAPPLFTNRINLI